MRSRAELRRAAEWALRAMLLVVLVVVLWRSLRPSATPFYARSVSARTLQADLTRALASSDATTLDVSVDSAISRADRDWLVALRHAGVPVRWRGDVPSMAIELGREREPAARARIAVVSGSDVPLTLADSAGALESVRASHGAILELTTLVGAVRARRDRFVARAAAGGASKRRAVAVLGRADWETRFVMAALTEAGWPVRARIPTAPGVAVRDDAFMPLDTARYDAVVALDSSAADLASSIGAFVVQGGGLILAGDALALDPLSAIAPARAGDRQPGRILLASDTLIPRDLPLRPLDALRSDAVVLERGSSGIALAARRAGLGRILAIGYDETWRWRMLGGVSGLASHRAWWSRAVGGVAPERAEDSPAGDGDAAPRAALVQSLGAASSGEGSSGDAPPGPRMPGYLLSIVVAALLGETASRRFRGAR